MIVLYMHIQETYQGKIYKYIQDDGMLLHNKFLGWRKELGGEKPEGLLDYVNTYRNVYKTTNIPKYRSFPV